MIFRQMIEPESAAYSYLLAAAEGGEALLVDPVQTQVSTYLALIASLKLQLVVAVDTHTHADHITGMGDLRSAAGCSTMMGEYSRAECVTARFRDGERIPVGGLAVRAIYTPGHTDDSFSLVMPDRVFTGDTLLIGGTGRTDLQNGDAYGAFHSLFHKLLRLAGTTRVFPGHDYRGRAESTIAEERATNPRLQVESAEQYAVLMASLNLPVPRMMEVAIPANLRCGQT